MKVRYICKHCGNVNSIDSFWKWFWTPHLGAKKYLRCRHCYQEKHFMKRCDEEVCRSGAGAICAQRKESWRCSYTQQRCTAGTRVLRGIPGFRRLAG